MRGFSGGMNYIVKARQAPIVTGRTCEGKRGEERGDDHAVQHAMVCVLEFPRGTDRAPFPLAPLARMTPRGSVKML